MPFFELIATPKETYNEAVKQFDAQNYSRAVLLFEKALRNGYTEAAYTQLAYCYLEGKGTAKNAKRCFELTAIDAQKGEKTAINNLAYLYNNGIGVETDKAKAIELFKKAAALGYVDAAYTLAQIYRKQRQSVSSQILCRDYLKMAASKNHKDSVALMAKWFGPLTAEDVGSLSKNEIFEEGRRLQNGIDGYPKDHEEALRWFEYYTAQFSNDYAGWTNKGYNLYQLGRYKEANEAYQMAFELGSSVAAMNLAYNIHNGKGCEYDEKRLASLLRSAHEMGSEKALTQLYEWFPGEQKADQLEAELAQTAVDDYDKINRIALDFMELGRFSETADLTRHVLEQTDSSDAMAIIGQLYVYGLVGDDKKNENAFAFFAEAAEADNFSQLRTIFFTGRFLHYCYSNYENLGVANWKSSQPKYWVGQQAIKFIKESARHNHPLGTKLLATQYMLGDYGLDKDWHQAELLLKKSIALGCNDAKYTLGFLYFPTDSRSSLEAFLDYVGGNEDKDADYFSACKMIGQILIDEFFRRDDVNRIDHRAYKYCLQAVNQEPDAMAVVGACLYWGTTQRFPNRSEGLALMRKAKNDGSDFADTLLNCL